ncbi:MAG: hypothetical protein KJO11_13645 [Gemmatimonadetes bacterium]|nr:hypothetical protein [Gemmatimonadota bacterium]NNF38839.1 hypothetical protein [Gemmatimonadota bacterium]
MTASRSLCAAFTALLIASVPASAQSLFASRGLGLPLFATDSRVLALGGIGVGLPGGELSLVDPSAPAGLSVPSVAFAFQSTWADADEDGTPTDFSGTRFPFLSLGYPTSFGTVTVAIGSVLDQRWIASSSEQVDLDGNGRLGVVTDRFESDGGISSVRLGLARTLPGGVAVGAQVGRNIGDVSRVFSRSFDSLNVGTPVPDFTAGGRWSYRGWTWAVGASGSVGSILRLGGSYTWSSELDALPDENTDGAEGSFGLPAELRLGATAILSPRLSISGGIQTATWSEAAADLTVGGARDVFSWGGGVEWAGASVLGKPSAIRLGYRASELPFTLEDALDPTETAFTGGLGMDLLTGADVVLARLDLTLERGLREAGSFEERFWRFSTSVRVSGF